MKPLAIWATGVLVAFGALAGVTSATRDTEHVFVVVDVSQPMESSLSRVPAELDSLDDQQYAEFALAFVRGTELQSLHGYQSELEWANQDSFRPCSFENIDSFAEASSADERILITNSQSCPTDGLNGWTIVEIDR